MEIFWNKITGQKLITKDENVETYEANMKIMFKKIKAKNGIELIHYKNQFKLNQNYKKIYDIFED